MNADPRKMTLTGAPPVGSSDLLAVGTRIRFIKMLDDGPNEERPAVVYAEMGETGEITGHGTPEGYWVKTDRCPHSFGASIDEIEEITANDKLRHGGDNQKPL